MNEYDGEPLRALVGELRMAYPGWSIGLTECHGGQRLVAHRPASAGSLVAVITEDPGELRRELDDQ